MNLTVVLTISLSPLSTNLNMRVPTAELLTFFAATGQFSGPSLRKILITFMTCMRLMHVLCHFHIASAKFSLLDQPACDKGRLYTVQPGDICNSIAADYNAPTLVSTDNTFAHFTYALKYSYQIMCQNDQINGGCTNLSPGEVKFVLRLLLGTF
jgi:hypothetical protein